jgi:hypothetical protein
MTTRPTMAPKSLDDMSPDEALALYMWLTLHDTAPSTIPRDPTVERREHYRPRFSHLA